MATDPGEELQNVVLARNTLRYQLYGIARIAYGVRGPFLIISPTLRSVSTSIARSLPL